MFGNGACFQGGRPRLSTKRERVQKVAWPPLWCLASVGGDREICQLTPRVFTLWSAHSLQGARAKISMVTRISSYCKCACAGLSHRINPSSGFTTALVRRRGWAGTARSPVPPCVWLNLETIKKKMPLCSI